jgi:hypothetical protein
MGLRIVQDVAAKHAYRNLSVTADQLSTSMDKLSGRSGTGCPAHDAAAPSLTDRT